MELIIISKISSVHKNLNISKGAFRADSGTLILIQEKVESKLKSGIYFSISTHKFESDKSQSSSLELTSREISSSFESDPQTGIFESSVIDFDVSGPVYDVLISYY